MIFFYLKMVYTFFKNGVPSCQSIPSPVAGWAIGQARHMVDCAIPA